MPQFAPDQVAFKDLPGYGMYDIGHMREHLQFVQVLSTASPAIVLPDFDFLQFLTAGSARGSIMQSHYQSHLLLRGALGITGTDLSAFNLDSADDFYSFLSYHSSEHAFIRQQLGIT